MPNSYDFLVALDDHLRGHHTAAVAAGYDMYAIARSAGLETPGAQPPVPMWVGELVNGGFVAHGPQSLRDQGPPTVYAWTERELSRFGDYRLTPAGHEHADRLRRQAREAITDATLGAGYPGHVAGYVLAGG